MSISRRSNRMRFKPLEHWNNEKLQYNLNGDLQYIKRMVDGPTVNPKDLLHDTVVNKSWMNLSFVPLKKPEKKHEVSILKVIPLSTQSLNIPERDSRKCTARIDSQNVLTECKMNDLNRKSFKASSTETCASVRTNNNISKINQRKGTDFEQYSKDVKYRKYDKSRREHVQKKNNTVIVNNITEITSSQEVSERSISKSGSEDIGYSWKLSDMKMVENEWNEKYFFQRGQDIPASNLQCGFVFLLSKTLHWEESVLTKEILVIEGNGKIVVEDDNKKKQVNLSKGLRLKVKKGKTLLEKTEDCAILKLFVVYS